MTNVLLLNAVAILIFSQQLLAFALKRDKQDKYILWPLLLPPLTLIYVLVWPAISSGRAMEMNSFFTQVLVYQIAAAILALLCKQNGQLGQAGFWLAAAMNLGSCLGLFMFTAG